MFTCSKGISFDVFHKKTYLEHVLFMNHLPFTICYHEKPPTCNNEVKNLHLQQEYLFLVFQHTIDIAWLTGMDMYYGA